jgi:hypothetical protein
MGGDKLVLNSRSRSTEVAQNLKQILAFGEPTNKHIINKGSSKKNTHFKNKQSNSQILMGERLTLPAAVYSKMELHTVV